MQIHLETDLILFDAFDEDSFAHINSIASELFSYDGMNPMVSLCSFLPLDSSKGFAMLPQPQGV